jgi:hypothetical protein
VPQGAGVGVNWSGIRREKEMAYIEINVDLSEFDTEELIEELGQRGKYPQWLIDFIKRFDKASLTEQMEYERLVSKV